MDSTPLLDCAGRRRSPATMSGFHQGRPPRNKGSVVMAGNDGGIPPILAQKHYAQPSAFTPENLLRGTGRSDVHLIVVMTSERVPMCMCGSFVRKTGEPAFVPLRVPHAARGGATLPGRLGARHVQFPELQRFRQRPG